MNDPASDFRGAMEQLGPIFDGAIEADGEIHRVHIKGDSPGSENGWYLLHVNGRPAGEFGSWKTGVKVKWKADGEPPDDVDLAEIARNMEAEKRRREEERAKKHQEVADDAAKR